MASWYYSIGVVEEIEEGGSRDNGGVDRLEDAVDSEVQEVPELVTVPREYAIPSKRYYHLRGLKRSRDRTEGWCRRVMDMRVRHALRRRGFGAPKFNRWTDLNDNLIGRFYKSDRCKASEDICLSDEVNVKGYGFHFVKTKKGYSNVGEFVIRAAVYPTDEGRDRVIAYIGNYLKEKSKVNGRQVSIDEVFREKRTISVKIQDADVHINIDGKINILFVYEGLSGLLHGLDKLFGEKRRKLKRFAEFSQNKYWVMNTNQIFNQYIRNAFGLMAKVTDTMFSYGDKGE